MIGTVLLPNGIAIVLLLVLVFSINRNLNYMMLFDTKLFYVMLLCNLVQCIGEIIAYFIDGSMVRGAHTLILVVNSALFILNIIFAYLWVIYANYKINESIESIKKDDTLLAIPAALIILGSIINLFVPVFFRVTPDNHYERTGLFWLPYLVTYFYLAYGTIFIYRRKAEAKKYVFLPAILFMMPILFGSILQYFFYGISTVWAGVSIALMSVYVNVQNELSYIDSLSGIYTRSYMYQYLDAAIRKKNQQGKIAGIMLDIDSFKLINDTYGHLVGDDAIRSAGRILHHALNNDGIAVRYGGDEFVILQSIHNEDEILSTMQHILKAEEEFNQSKNKKYTLHFSQGYSIFDISKDTVDSFVDRMDHIMYDVKNANKLKQSEVFNNIENTAAVCE